MELFDETEAGQLTVATDIFSPIKLYNVSKNITCTTMMQKLKKVPVCDWYRIGVQLLVPQLHYLLWYCLLILENEGLNQKSDNKYVSVFTYFCMLYRRIDSKTSLAHCNDY